MEGTEPMETDKKRPARYSKNKKRNWNKVDLAETEKFLEKKRADQIQFGGDIGDQKDEDLFFIDRTGSAGKKVQKAPHVERILQNKSKIEPPICVQPRAQTNKSKRQEEVKLKRRFQTLNLQQQAAKNRKTLSQVQKEQTSLPNTYDLWAQKPATSKFTGEEHARTIDGRARVKRPEKMKYKPDRAVEMDSIVPAHPGASYNPDFDAHQALLREEIDRAEKEKVVRNKYFKNCQPPPAGERVTAEDIVNESMQGLGLLPDEEYETDEDEEADELPVIKEPIRAENRKSPKQRLKEKKVRIEQTRARRRKKLRILMNQIYEVKRIKREIREQDTALEERRKYRKEKGAKRMPRLGQVKYKAPEQDLKLSTELTGTLRQLVPEGHVLTDRLESFMSRTMIEPRGRQGRQKLKFRPKWQQKRTFREFDEKFDADLKKDEKMAK